MRLLLDTHAFLWALAEPEKLQPEALAVIVDASNTVLVSAAVPWEIAIKAARGRIGVPGNPASWFPALVRSSGFQLLPIVAEHALAVWGLPLHHRDPFDRIMIAQAQVEGLTFVTRDPENHRYPVRLLTA